MARRERVVDRDAPSGHPVSNGSCVGAHGRTRADGLSAVPCRIVKCATAAAARHRGSRVASCAPTSCVARSASRNPVSTVPATNARMAEDRDEERHVGADAEHDVAARSAADGARDRRVPRFGGRRSASRAADRRTPTPRRLRPRRRRRECPGRAARDTSAADRPAAGNPAPDPRRRRGTRSRGRAARVLLRPRQRLAAGDAQLRVHEIDAGRPASVTGCSTCRRVFISRKKNRASSPSPSSRNSTVPALT